MVDIEPLVARHLQTTRIEPKLVQDGRVDVGHIVSIFHRMKAKFVGRAMDDPALHSTAGHPGGEAEGVVVPTVAIL